MDRYFVDWSDSSFPAIRLFERGTEGEDSLTLGQAKTEIIEHFRREMKFAVEIIKETKAIRAADFRKGGRKWHGTS